MDAETLAGKRCSEILKIFTHHEMVENNLRKISTTQLDLVLSELNI